jgi:hypothetical protein
MAVQSPRSISEGTNLRGANRGKLLNGSELIAPLMEKKRKKGNCVAVGDERQ